MATEHQSTRSLLAELVANVNTLIRQELRLAQAETSEKVSQVLNGVISIFGGLLMAAVALLVLVEAVVLALANIIDPGWAALIVGGVLALLAFILVQMGVSKLKVGNLLPERAMQSMREDREMVGALGVNRGLVYWEDGAEDRRLLFTIIDRFVGLRVEAQPEALGLDLHEHATQAYPEFVVGNGGDGGNGRNGGAGDRRAHCGAEAHGRRARDDAAGDHPAEQRQAENDESQDNEVQRLADRGIGARGHAGDHPGRGGGDQRVGHEPHRGAHDEAERAGRRPGRRPRSRRSRPHPVPTRRYAGIVGSTGRGAQRCRTASGDGDNSFSRLCVVHRGWQ